MAVSFPYPTIGTVKREPGNGCVGSCVHTHYCMAYYWYLRYSYLNKTQDENSLGIACNSWSNNVADQITTMTPDDIAENLRLNNEGILAEGTGSNPGDVVTTSERYPWD